mgnify:CR=1 FL=1
MFNESNEWKRLANSKDVKNHHKKLVQIKKNIYKNYSKFSFLKFSNNKEVFYNLKKSKKKFENTDKFLLIGTGGSSLGTKALMSIFNKNNIEFLENLDPYTVNQYFQRNRKNSFGLIVVSKSGETLEVLSLFDIILSESKNKQKLIKNTIIITDKTNSTLRKIAIKNNIDVLDHDESIGGRFSCFSLTSLLPLHLSGVNSIELKKLVDESFKRNLAVDNHSSNTSISIMAKIINEKKYVGHVFLVYIDSFINIGKWFKQLWTESLGKNGKGLHLISATGAIDQHSQLQMWLDGPKNLIFTIVIPRKRYKDIKIRNKNKLLPTYLKDKKIGELLNIMGEATAIELKKSGIPVRIIYLENDKADSAINLMTTLLLEVALIGKLIGINPFNQPAVEKVKLRIKKILNKE